MAESVNQLVGPELGVLIITHYQRMLNYVSPQRVHVMLEGRIVRLGGPRLATSSRQKGYEGLRAELGIEGPAPTEGSE